MISIHSIHLASSRPGLSPGSAATTRVRLARRGAACLLFAAIVGAASTLPASAQVMVPLYRGVQASPAGNVVWNNTSFGISGNPPTLSLFDTFAAVQNNFPCVVQIVASVPAPVAPGSIGTLAVPMPPAQVNPWPVVFDNVPAGHWSIAKAAMFLPPLPSNNQAGNQAALVFQAMTAAIPPAAVVMNGTQQNCQP